MIDTLEKPNVKGEPSADAQIASVIRKITDEFGGNLAAYFESIRPKPPREDRETVLQRRLVELAVRNKPPLQ